MNVIFFFLEMHMKKLLVLTFALAIAFFATACGGNSTHTEEPADSEPANDSDQTEEPAETDEEPVEEPDDQPAENTTPENFNPENPGYFVEFIIADINMANQPQTLATGYFMKAAREDLNPHAGVDESTFDTCTFGESIENVPQCTSKADCAPEQDCVPSYDSQSGQAIANSEHCETPGRESLDVGPITVSGFNGGPYQFAYEPGDQAYKLNGTGDGTIPAEMIAYGVDYTISGENMLPDDLDSLSATFSMPPSFAILEPVPQPNASGGFGDIINVTPGQPLTIKWVGNNGLGYIDVNFMVMKSLMEQVAITCRMVDDGEFTVPAEFTSEMQLSQGDSGSPFGDMLGMMNMITVNRHVEAPITGKGITAGTFSAEQMVLYTLGNN